MPTAEFSVLHTYLSHLRVSEGGAVVILIINVERGEVTCLRVTQLAKDVTQLWIQALGLCNSTSSGCQTFGLPFHFSLNFFKRIVKTTWLKKSLHLDTFVEYQLPRQPQICAMPPTSAPHLLGQEQRRV